MNETLQILLWLTAALTFKHFLADFVLQRAYQFRNKGKYGHLGGLLHAAIHGFGTFLALLWAIPLHYAAMFALADMVVHYHIDWLKARLNQHMKLSPTEGAQYWMLFGFDQFLHHMTYVGILSALVALELLY